MSLLIDSNTAYEIGQRLSLSSAKVEEVITAAMPALLAKLAGVDAEPLFWYRPRSDGFYEGPIHNAQIEEVRKESGSWEPLHTLPGAAALQAMNEQLRDQNTELDKACAALEAERDTLQARVAELEADAGKWWSLKKAFTDIDAVRAQEVKL